MRRIVAFAFVAVVLGACADPSVPPSGTDPPGPSASPAGAERLDAYTALLTYLSGMEGGPDGTLFIRSQICETAADPSAGKDERCDDAFSSEEQRELSDRLSSFGKIAFVADYSAIPEGQAPIDHPGSVFVWVGPLEDHGGQTWAGGGMTCGGLCGHGGTYVLMHDEQGWRVEGNAPGTSAWIS
jgi:hypothetical protein